MKIVPRRDSFARMTNNLYSDTECPICKYGIRPGEAAAKNQNGQICHAECVEEERYGAQFTGGYCYR